MAYLGKYQLGQTLQLRLLCSDASGTPTAPTFNPQVQVWSATAKVLAALMPIQDRYVQSGVFRYPLQLGAAYSVGYYSVVYHFNVAGYFGVETDNFEVAAGGHADGDVVAMCFFDRPHAKFIVHATNTGRIIQGKNPTL